MGNQKWEELMWKRRRLDASYEFAQNLWRPCILCAVGGGASEDFPQVHLNVLARKNFFNIYFTQVSFSLQKQRIWHHGVTLRTYPSKVSGLSWQTLTFYDEVEEFWPRAALALDGARVQAIVGDIDLRYLKAVLMFVPDARHNGHARVHRPLVVPCEYDAGAVQPGSFRDPIQQVAPAVAEKWNTGCMNPNRQGILLKFVSFDI